MQGWMSSRCAASCVTGGGGAEGLAQAFSRLSFIEGVGFDPYACGDDSDGDSY